MPPSRNPHAIFSTKRREDVFGIRLYNKGDGIQQFDTQTPMHEIKAFAANWGDGHYTLMPLDENNKPYRAYKTFDIDEAERARAAEAKSTIRTEEQSQALTFVNAQLDEVRQERIQLRTDTAKLQDDLKNRADDQSKSESTLIREFMAQQEEARRADETGRREEEAKRRTEEEARRLEHAERMAALQQEQSGFLAQQGEIRVEAQRGAAVAREERLRRDFEQQAQFLQRQYEQQIKFLETTLNQQLLTERTQHARELEMLRMRSEELDKLREAEHKLELRTAKVKLEKEFGWGHEKIPTDVKREMLLRKMDRDYPEPSPLERIFERIEPVFDRFMEIRESVSGAQGQLPPGQHPAASGATAPPNATGSEVESDDLPEVFEM